MTTWQDAGHTAAGEVAFDLPAVPFTLHRAIDPAPFVPKKESDLFARCETILGLQAAGLKTRLSGALRLHRRGGRFRRPRFHARAARVRPRV